MVQNSVKKTHNADTVTFTEVSNPVVNKDASRNCPMWNSLMGI